MRRNAIFLYVSVCCLPFSVSAAEKKITTQYEMTQNSCREFKEVDLELTQVYNQVIENNKTQEVFIRNLKKAENSWIKYRDSHLSSVYSDPAENYGSVHPMCVCLLKTEMTKSRISELKRFLEVTEGDVCGY